MGFHVSLAELTKAATKLSQEAERLEEQLETAKKSVNKIITSEALTGQTGQAIYHQLNNVDAAILVGLADTTKLLASDMYQLIAEFQASVGETSTTAVLDEDYLNQLKDQLSNFKNQHGEQEETIAGIYASVSDLISLSSPQSNYDTDSDAASQYLSNTIDKVTSFNSAGSELSSESLLTAIDSKVNQVSQTTSLSYSDSQYLSFVNDASFAKGIKSVNKQLKEQEKLAKEEAAKEAQAAWAKHHPVEAWLQSQAAKNAQFFEGARQTLEQTHWDYFGGALDKSLALSVLGFISKASETVDQLAIGIGELSHLAVEGIEWGGNTLFNQTTPQWIKDDITGATNNLLAASEFTDSLLALDAEAWGAVGKELGKIGTDFVTAVKTGDDYALGGYVFDVATLVGPASISKLKYVDEASALTKLAETSEVEKRVEIIDKVKSAFTSGTEIKPGTQIDVVSQKTAGTTIKETVSSVKVPETYLTTAERYNEIPIVEYAQQMSKDYTSADVEELTRLTTHNANSDTALLGPYSPDTSSYEQIAHENGFTYFDAGTNGWNAISEVDGNLAYRVNDEFLQQQIDSGKDIVLTHDPAAAYKTYVESNGRKMVSYNKELNILKKYGYHIVKDGQFWRATK